MISIIVPYYHGDATIRAALQSCAAGCRIGAQLIVVFDSPEDERSLAVKAWINAEAGTSIPAATLLQNEANLGQVRSRRRAIEFVQTDRVVFLDQDDELTPARFRPEDLAGYDIGFYQTLRKSPKTETFERHTASLKYASLINIPLLGQLMVARRQPARLGATTVSTALARRYLPETGGGGEEWEFFTGLSCERLRRRYFNTVGLVRHVHGANQSITQRRERLERWLQRVEASPFNVVVRRHAAHLVRQAIAREDRQ